MKPFNIIGESKFNAKIRVNVREEEGLVKFLEDFGGKSGTSYNILYGDRKSTSGIVSGFRKCEHNVRRHHFRRT